jgi:hypothetical protein
MAKNFDMKAVITAVDKLSPTLNRMNKNLAVFRRRLEHTGQGAGIMAAGLAAALAIPARAYMELEQATSQLQNTLMLKGGVIPKQFAAIEKIAVELGNKLPGTTADFMAMASTLKSLGMSANTIQGGALEAVANLGVVGKPLGVTYETAASAVAKFSNSLGVAQGDLVPFADTVQRAMHLGVDLTQMEYALSRIGGVLGAMGQSGKGVANNLVPLVALLSRQGLHGEEIGTGLAEIIQVFAQAGKFSSVEKMVKDLEKLYKISGKDRIKKFIELFGKDHAKKALMIGKGGYQAIVGEMKEQASLQERINNSLGTTQNLLEAMTGTATNAAAALGKTYDPELKEAATWMNRLAETVGKWIPDNKKAIKGTLMMATAFVAFKVAVYGAAVAIGFLNGVLSLSPVGWFIRLLALGAGLIIANWDTVGPYFQKLFDLIQKGAASFSEDWDNAIKGFGQLWQDTTDAVFGVWDAMGRRWSELVNDFKDGMAWLKNLPMQLGTDLFNLGYEGLTGNAAPLAADIQGLSKELGAAYQVDPALIRSIIRAESGGNPDAVSSKGAQGLMQLMPATARRFGVMNAFDPGQNVSGGTAYLRFLLKRYGGDEAKAIAAYNAGEGNIDKGIVPADTRAYTAKVLDYLRKERMQGQVDVNFNNTPPGTRVEPKGGKGMGVKANVGYRTLGMEGAR